MEDVMESTSDAMTADSPAGTAEVNDQATITLLRGGQPTDSVFAINGKAVIGRFDPSHGPIDIDLGGLEEGSYVSRKHASIEKTDNGYTISDLGSSNGTWTMQGNDFARVESAPLTDGMIFALGNAQFVFHSGANAAPAAEEPAPEPAAETSEPSL